MSASGATALDAIVVGGGHNGLACAWHLASAGRRVLVLEAAAQPGGAADTRELAPGFRVPACAHLLYEPAAALRGALQRDGLEFAATALPTTALAADRPALVLPAGGAGAAAGLADAEAARVRELLARMLRHAAVLRGTFAATPPRLGTRDWRDWLRLARLGWAVRSQGRGHMRDLLRIGAMNIHDLLQDELSDPLLQGMLAFDAVLGSNYGPRSPGSVLTWLHRLASGAASPSQPRGGMGAVGAALARAATAAGAQVRTATAVRRILVEDDRACGVELAGGEVLHARCVVSSLEPKATLLGLLGAAQLDTNFVRSLTHLRGTGLAAKLHLALSAPPRFSGATPDALRGRIVHAPTPDYIERAFNASKYGEPSAEPALEITVPSANDPSLAPPGAHVLSAIVQYVPATLGPAAGQPGMLEAALALLERLAPGIRSTVVAAEFLAPADLAQRYGSGGGHWHHAELAFDQFHLLRPVPHAAQYATPVAGLYLCGAGSHPGGGVLGHAGGNAAREVLHRERAA
jgi:phytoene dehydrogenase-like protein